MNNSNLNYAILKYLTDLANSTNSASLKTGLVYLENSFNLQINNENDQKYSTNVSLTSLFPQEEKKPEEKDEKFGEYIKLLESKGYFNGTHPGSAEYEERVSKAKEKFYSQVPDPKVKSEQLKNKGNAEFKAGDYMAAIQSYSDAIDVHPNAIYFCNRAIAYNKLNKHDEAIVDYLKCIELDSKYIKAYDRLGFTYMNLSNHQEAIEIFQKGLEVDPLNNDLNKHLQQALSAIEGDMGGMGGGNAPNVPQMPNLGNLGNMGNMGDVLNNPNFMEGLGGMLNNPNMMEGLGGMMNNPEFMQMTMNMMNDPNFQNFVQNMAQNPQIANLFGGMGGMGGGNQQ